jgi:peptidoglycan/LPS O-acetylase OafA/YrhL
MVVVGLLTSGRDTAVAASFGLTLVALRRWDGLASDLAWLGPLRACGRRCYSVYLAHLPVCVIGTAALVELGLVGFWARALVVIPLVSIAAVAVSWMFFDVVELRFLKPPAVCARGMRGRRWPLHAALAGNRTPAVAFELSGRAAWVRAGGGVRGGAP